MALIHPYESMAILDPGLTKEEADKLVDRYVEVVKAGGGEVSKVERMGKRKLAYPMRKHSEGSYVLMVFNSPSAVVFELERQLRRAHEEHGGATLALHGCHWVGIRESSI